MVMMVKLKMTRPITNTVTRRDLQEQKEEARLLEILL